MSFNYGNYPNILTPTSYPRLGRSTVGYPVLDKSAMLPVPRLGFTVRAENKHMINLLDKQAKTFRDKAFYGALATANQQIAIKIQEGMVRELNRQMEENTRRSPKGPNTKRLENALLHENNRQVFANTFSVGLPAWMDQSPAKAYWRQIEYGNVRRPSTALWTNTFAKGDWWGPWSEDGGNDEQPPGYAHRIAIEGKTGTYMIGPFPAYRYSIGGARVARAIDYKARYKEVLLAALGATGTVGFAGVFKGRGTVHMDMPAT